MILNTADNGKIIKYAKNIRLNTFTVITGENGSGKTQLLEFIRDNVLGFGQSDINGDKILDKDGSLVKLRFPVVSDNNIVLKDIVYTYPGLRRLPAGHMEDERPLFEIIEQRWYSLAPIVNSYRSINHFEFSSIDAELNALQTAIESWVKGVTDYSHGYSQLPVRKISKDDLQYLKDLSHKCHKPIEELSFSDFVIFYEVPLGIFSTSLDLLFHQFELKKRYYPEMTQNVLQPLNVFNEILVKAKFNYSAEYEANLLANPLSQVKLKDCRTNKEVDFQNLSSGEMTILALIFALYKSESNEQFPEIILFDEPDAHLHPSLTQIFLDVIQEVFVKKHRVNIILTTHSPSTVALAPEESIYCMDRDLGFPVKEEKQTAINILSSGLASLTIEESNLGINYNIKKANTHILFTEGITDKIYLEIAWDKLYPGKKMNFLIQDCFSASVLGNLFRVGDDAPDGIFHQFSEVKMIALFDFDHAGYSNWNSGEKKFPHLVEENPRKCLTRSNAHNGFLMLLPVPEISEIQRQVIISENCTYKDQSYLTIESLFFDIEELKAFFTEKPLPGEGIAHVFTGNKKKLSKKLQNLPASAFKGFIPLFEKVEWILEN